MRIILSAALCFICSLSMASTEKLRVTRNNFAAIPSSVNSPQGFTNYLRVAGSAPSANPKQLLQELQKTMVDPLEGQARYMFVGQVDGAGEYFFNLVSEPIDLAHVVPYKSAIANIKANGYKGQPITGQQVEKFFETAHLEGGLFDPKTQSSQAVFEVTRNFAMSTLSEWEKFTDTLGFAVLANQNKDLIAYLQTFLGDDAAFQQVKYYLAQSNKVTVHAEPYVILADNSVIDPDSAQTPFFTVPFVRDCWMQSSGAVCAP